MFCKKNNGIVKSNELYLVNGKLTRKFKKLLGTECCNTNIYGLDFADWVDSEFYSAWGRRSSWFEEVPMDESFSVESNDYCIVPAGTLYKPCESIIDYLIVDEAQDFNATQYCLRFIPKVGKSISLLGDSNQKMISSGNSIQQLRQSFPNYKIFNLRYNYRLPKTIAKVAQKIIGTDIDLLIDNKKNGGNSDYPYFPKPIVKRWNYCVMLCSHSRGFSLIMI